MTKPGNLVFALCLIFSSALLCNAQEQNAPAPPASDAPVTTGNGTVGKIPKFTTNANIDDSVMTESAAKIGVNIAAPKATLHVNSAQPAPAATAGKAAAPLLQTSGGKGGNTTGATGQKAGAGAGISLVAGGGGDAPSGSTNGAGGNITLEPGLPGAGAGNPGSAGNVLIAPAAGNVGVGTSSPAAKLHAFTNTGADAAIKGENKSTDSFFSPGVVGTSVNGTGVFASGKSIGVQAQGLTGVMALGGETGLHATGSARAVRGISPGGVGVYGQSTSGDGVYGEAVGGSGVSGKATGAGTGVSGTGGTGKGVYGQSDSNSGVFGFSGTGDGVTGQSASGYAGNFLGKAKVAGNFEVGGTQSFGAATRQMIHLYNQTYGIGVQSATFYFRTDGAFNWYRGGAHSNTANSPGSGGVSLMRLSSAGNLTVTGSVTATNFANSSDRAVKSNFSAVNPRAVLDKLAALPVQTWSYRAEESPVRHMGPMAQDFKAAFDLGADDKTISTVDAAGVTMAAVQGLYQLSLEKDRKIERLTAEVDELKARLQRLEEAVRGRQK